MPKEVNRQYYDDCVNAGACQPLPEVYRRTASVNQLPVAGVTRDEASAMCAWINGRLPTGPEWEIAARGGFDRRYPWGNEPYCPYLSNDEKRERERRLSNRVAKCPAFTSYALPKLTDAEAGKIFMLLLLSWTDEEFFGWCRELALLQPDEVVPAVHANVAARNRELAQWKVAPTCGVLTTLPVWDGISGPKGSGFSGNVAEWVADEAAPPKGSVVPHGIVRGGSFATDALAWRVSAAMVLPVDSRSPDIGFRCVRSVIP
jgi:formylglycine-generating enzyme required for sulfatase activity